MIAGILVSIGVGTKIIGCGIPSLFFLKYKDDVMKVEIGMVSRGDIELIVAGIGATSGVL